MTMTWIAGQTVGAGGTSVVNFGSIPSTFTHLQVKSFARQTGATTNQSILVTFNSDSAANYTQHRLVGNGSTASSDSYTTSSGNGFTSWSGIPAANDTASVFGASIVDILDYTNTNKNKTIRNLSGYDGNGSGLVYFTSGLWLSTSAISTITLTSQSGNFAQFSRFDLYGITTSTVTGA